LLGWLDFHIRPVNKVLLRSIGVFRCPLTIAVKPYPVYMLPLSLIIFRSERTQPPKAVFQQLPLIGYPPSLEVIARRKILIDIKPPRRIDVHIKIPIFICSDSGPVL